MTDVFTLTDLFGLFGNILAIVFFLIPIQMMVNLIKTKDISTVPWLMFIFTILNCELWMVYGLKIKAWPIYICNGVGIFTNNIYLVIYIIYSDQTKALKTILIFMIFVLFSSMFAVFYSYIDNTKLIGGIACIMNIFMFASPLQNIKKVYEKKDNSFIPIYVCVCFTLGCLVWIIYGCLKEMDYFIIIPNAIGLILSLFQVYLWFHFRTQQNTKQKIPEKNFDPLNEENNSDEELNDIQIKNVKIDVNKFK